MFCDLEGREAGALGLLEPSLSLSPLVELREVCIAFLEAETKDRPGWHLPPRPSLVRCPGFVNWALAEDASYTLICGESFLGWRMVCGVGSPETSFLNNAWTVLSVSLFWNVWIIPQVLKQRPVSPQLAENLAGFSGNSLLSLRPCLNTIIYRKASLNQETPNLSDSSLSVLFTFCLVLISLHPLWWAWQWCWFQWWFC